MRFHAVVLGGVLATGAHVAHADDHAAPTAPASSTMYLQVGSAISTQGDAPWIAGTLDGGYRLGTSIVWLHGQAAYGHAAESWGGTWNGDYASARAGLELPSFGSAGLLKGYFGIDAGYRSIALGEKTTIAGPMVVGRGGVEFGTPHVRVRLGVEQLLAKRGAPARSAVAAAVAFQF